MIERAYPNPYGFIFHCTECGKPLNNKEEADNHVCEVKEIE